MLDAYQRYLRENPEWHPAVAAIRVLTEVLRDSQGMCCVLASAFVDNLCTAKTIMGLQIELKAAAAMMRDASRPLTVDSGCELFMFFVQHFSETFTVCCCFL